MYVADDFAITPTSVTLRGSAIRGADPSSFRHLYGAWSRDDRAVFWSVFRKPKINPATFEPLNEVWGRDATAAFPSSGKPLDAVDPCSFRVFDAGLFSDGAPSVLGPMPEGFAGDDQRVFFFNSTYPSAWEVKKAKAASFVSMGARYGRDADAVFYEQRIVKQAQPRSFRLIGMRGYAADQNRVYFCGKEIEGADPASFAILRSYGLEAARDRNGYYCRGRPATLGDYVTILEADSKKLEEHIGYVRSGRFDQHYRSSLVDRKA